MLGHVLILCMPPRKHIRLRNFDYSSANAYFITICVKNFDCHLGQIRNGIVVLSEIGNVAACHLQNIPDINSDAILDEFIVMPNHLHCIIELTGKTFSIENSNRYAKLVGGSISVIMNQYKGSVKNGVMQMVLMILNCKEGFSIV